MSGRAGRDGVDGRLTGTRDGEPTGWNLWDARNSGHTLLYLESLRHNYEAILSSNNAQSHAISRRHPTARTRQPATDGGRADRADKARIRVRLLACCAVAAIPPAP